MIGRVELREERLGVHVRNLIEQNQGTQIGAIDAGVIADRVVQQASSGSLSQRSTSKPGLLTRCGSRTATRVFIALTQASPARATLTLLPVGLLAI